MNSPIKFWQFFNKAKDYLLNSNELPDYEKDIIKHERPLERPQLILFIQKYPKLINQISKLRSCGYEVDVYTLFYGFGILQGMTLLDIIDVQTSFDNFNMNKKQNKNTVNFIFLGSTTHWTVLVIENKLINNSNNVTFTHIDSSNLNYYQFKNETDIHNFVEDLEETYLIKYKKKKTTEFKKSMFRQFIKDINDLLIIIYKIIHEDFSLYSLHIEKTLENMLSSFEDCFKLLLDKEIMYNFEKRMIDDKNYCITKELFNRWLMQEYHPVILEEDLLKSIELFIFCDKIKELKSYEKFVIWIKFCFKLKELILNKEIYVKTEENFFSVVLKFYDFLDKLKQLIGISI